MSDPSAAEEPLETTTPATPSAPETPVASEPPKGPSWRSWAVAGAACGVVVVVGILLTRDHGDGATPLQATSVSPDQQVGPDGRSFADPGALGEITAIDGSTITLRSTRPGRSDSEEVTVETDDDTRFTDVVDGSLADVHDGDHLVVRGVDGDDDTDGEVVAASITDNGDEELGGGVLGGPGSFRTEGGGPVDGTMVLPEGATPPDGPPDGSTHILSRITAGTVTKVDGDQITLRAPQGDEVVVRTTTDTEVKVLEEIGIHDLRRGDEVRVTGERDDDVVTATSVRRGDDLGVLDGAPRRSRATADASAS
jgi:hypothetical protein